MDNETSKVMFALLRSAVYSDLLSDEEKLLYNADILPQIVKTAKHTIFFICSCLG